MPFQFDEVECTGAEGSLGECMFVTDHDCDHSEEAGVICIGKLLSDMFAVIICTESLIFLSCWSV